jgi:hypothetical protein
VYDFNAFIIIKYSMQVTSIPVKDAVELSSEELDCEFPVSLQSGSSTSLSLGLESECDNCKLSGELLASSSKFLIGSSMSLFCGLGRARVKRLGTGLDEAEHFSGAVFLRVFDIGSSSMLSSSVSKYELSSRDTCVMSPGRSGVR